MKILLKILFLSIICFVDMSAQHETLKHNYATNLDSTILKIEKISELIKEYDQILQDGIQNFSGYQLHDIDKANDYFEAITANARINKGSYFSFLLRHKDLLNVEQKKKAKNQVRILFSRDDPYFYGLMNTFAFKKYLNDFAVEIDDKVFDKILVQFHELGFVSQDNLNQLRKLSILINHIKPELDDSLINFVLSLNEITKKTESKILKKDQLITLVSQIIPSSISYLDGNRGVNETLFLLDDIRYPSGEIKSDECSLENPIYESYFLKFIRPKLKSIYKKKYSTILRTEGTLALKSKLSLLSSEDIWIKN